MARKTSTYIAVNELLGNKTGTATAVRWMAYNGYLGKRAVMDGKILFDQWDTVFEVSDFTMSVDGGYVWRFANVISYGLDVNGGVNWMDYDAEPSYMNANSSTESKTFEVTFTQHGTGESISVWCTQEAKSAEVTGYRYEARVTSEYIGVAAASGSTLSLIVAGYIDKYEVYSDNTESLSDSTPFDSVTAYITNGYSSADAYISGGSVVVESARDDVYTSNRTAYTITGYQISVDGRTYDETTNKVVQQSANRSTGKEYGNYRIVMEASKYTFTSSADSATISIDCQRSYRETYTSGYKSEEKWQDATATIKTSYGTLDKYSVTGKGSVKVSVGNDTGNGYTAVVTATVGDETASVSITQSVRVAKSVKYNTPTATAKSIGVAPAWGDTLYLSVDWKQDAVTTYDNGTTSTESVDGKTTATILGGSVQNASGAYISNGGVVVPSAGTNYFANEHNVFYVTSVEFYANNVRGTAGVSSFFIKRSANTYKTSKEYKVSLGSPSVDMVSALGGTFSVVAESYERTKYVYTSTSEKADDWTASAASVTYGGGVTGVSPATISGKATITASVGENKADNRALTVTVTSNGDINQTDTVTTWQSGAEYVLRAGDDVEASGAATTVYVTFESSKNGSALQPTRFYTDNSDATARLVSSSGSVYTVQVDILANKTDENRTIRVYAVQTRHNGDYTVNANIIQMAEIADSRQPMKITIYGAYTSTSKTSVNAIVTFDAMDTTKYKGGTASDVSIWLSDKADRTGSIIGSHVSLGDVTLAEGGYTNKEHTFYGTSSYSKLYLHISYNTTEWSSVEIDELSPLKLQQA